MDAFTQEMQEKLLKERDELLKKLNSEEDNFRQEALSASGRDSSDLASDDAAYRKMEALNAMDAKRLKSIEGALKRISEGKYGICLQCGKKIPEGRLRAIPSAVLCIECKTENEKLGM
ncbi:MAG TPA: TraR/DksA C4-type zinc finger protein [Candidatus Ornithospirochaeta stercorigallinarum]|nr:TraR/DksA C4-type zinc finger protein [Candidatus Ornithospirochaeta stercorigallinarum]